MIQKTKLRIIENGVPTMEGTYYRANPDGTASVLCFDTLDCRPVEAWVVDMPAADFAQRLADVRLGRIGSFTQDMLADYDGLHFDIDSPGYELLEKQVGHNMWSAF